MLLATLESQRQIPSRTRQDHPAAAGFDNLTALEAARVHPVVMPFLGVIMFDEQPDNRQYEDELEDKFRECMLNNVAARRITSISPIQRG
jgi:hypothetical protein